MSEKIWDSKTQGFIEKPTTFKAYVREGRLEIEETDHLDHTKRSVTYRTRMVDLVGQPLTEWSKKQKVDKFYGRSGDATPAEAIDSLKEWAVARRADLTKSLTVVEDTLKGLSTARYTAEIQAQEMEARVRSLRQLAGLEIPMPEEGK